MADSHSRAGDGEAPARLTTQVQDQDGTPPPFSSLDPAAVAGAQLRWDLSTAADTSLPASEGQEEDGDRENLILVCDLLDDEQEERRYNLGRAIADAGDFMRHWSTADELAVALSILMDKTNVEIIEAHGPLGSHESDTHGLRSHLARLMAHYNSTTPTTDLYLPPPPANLASKDGTPRPREGEGGAFQRALDAAATSQKHAANLDATPKSGSTSLPVTEAGAAHLRAFEEVVGTLALSPGQAREACNTFTAEYRRVKALMEPQEVEVFVEECCAAAATRHSCDALAIPESTRAR
jgi:hypothetical protein